MKNHRSIQHLLASLTLALVATGAWAQNAQPLFTRYNDPDHGTLQQVNIEQPASYLPGARVFFSLQGLPGGRASVSIETSLWSRVVTLSETDPGRYEGFYTVKPNDRINFDSRTRVSFASRIERHGRVGEAWTTAESQHHERFSHHDSLCSNCGRITDIQRVEEGSRDSNAPGIIIGGLLGGAIGNQVGQGSGRDAATALGLLGGAIAGNDISRKQNHRYVWIITVQLDNGALQTFKNNDQPNVSNGQRVRIVNNQLILD